MSASPRNPVPQDNDEPVADDAAVPGGKEAARRADRDGHRLRLSLGPGRAGGGRRHRAGRRLRRDDRPRLSLDRSRLDRGDADARRGGPPRPEDPAAGRRPSVRVLRGLRRPGDRDRPAVRQGGRLRRGQARARRDQRPARPRDRRGGDPGDGPRRPHSADGNGPRRLPRPGPDRAARARGRPRRARAPGGRLLLDRARGDSGRRRRGGHHDARDPRDRHRRRGHPPTGRCWCSTTCSASTTATPPGSSSVRGR